MSLSRQAFRAAPREGTGSWAIFADNMGSLSEWDDANADSKARAKIDARLVINAVQNAKVFSHLESRLEIYLQSISSKVSPDYDAIMKLDIGDEKTLSSMGATPVAAVKAYIDSTHTMAETILDDLQARDAQLVEIRESLDKQVEISTNTEQKLNQAMAKIHELEQSGTNNPAVLKDMAEVVDQARQSTKSGKIQAKKIRNSVDTLSADLRENESDVARTAAANRTDAPTQKKWLQAMNGLLKEPANLTAESLEENGFVTTAFLANEPKVLIQNRKHFQTLYDLADLRVKNEADAKKWGSAVERIKALLYAFQLTTAKGWKTIDKPDEEMLEDLRKIATTILAREYILQWSIENNMDPPKDFGQIFQNGYPDFAVTDRAKKWPALSGTKRQQMKFVKLVIEEDDLPVNYSYLTAKKSRAKKR
jgi:hypothetical protein